MELQAQQAQRTLFIDTLDLWLILLGGTLLVAALMLYRLGRWSDDERKSYALYYIFVGIYALATGIWATAVWPLPGPYNIIFSDAWPIFGVACLMLGFGLWHGVKLEYITWPMAPLGLPVIVYGIGIWAYGLTREPAASGLIFFALGLAVLLAPLELRVKQLRWLAIALLVISAALALYTGINAAYGHIAGWRAWSPWYGRVVVGGG